MSRDWRATAIYAVLAVIVVATIVLVGLGLRDGGLEPIELWFSLVAVVLPVAGIALTTLHSGRRQGVTVEEAASALAQKLRKHWYAESRHRGLGESRRIAVRWRREHGSEQSSQLSAELRNEGTLDELTGAFVRHVRAGHVSRLVVTGEPGAGKTALCVLLTLETTQPDVVPVLFPLSSWDGKRSLTDWMTEELAVNHPAVGDRAKAGQFAHELLRDHVLPVLDGLDEASDRAAALYAIQEEFAGRSFVLTSRVAEFAGPVPGRVLRDALVVRLQPLSAYEAGGVLERAGGVSMGPLLATLDAHPDGPVARALKTPFMLSLAVELGGALPEELLTAEGDDAEQRIKRYLLGGFVTQAYRRTVDKPHVPFPADEARGYLAFLARQTEPGTHRFAWWHLHRSVPRGLFLTVALANAALACSAAAVLLFALFERPWLGLWIGLGAAVIGALVVELVPQDDPRRAKPRLRSVRPPSRHALQRVLGFGVMGGAACAVIVAFLYERPVHVVVGGLLSGLTFAAARYFSEPSDPLEAVTPVSLLRSDRITIRYAWLTGAVPGALTGAYLGAALKEGRRTPELDDVTLIDELPSSVEALLGAASGALLSSVGLGMMALGSSAWGRFLPSRAWLALRGHTPRRLIRFAEDARERGVLRQVNGYYEFRHSLLHRHLAETEGPAAPSRSPAPAPAADTRTGPASSQ
ncbi:NACHT domain-containing protein [Streptomyces cupreus]|uniref:NACHT domain-containing protein n=1 Tax=Streptomyces cupreus TaxID=2759956 RepID=A0A7X1MCF1_9ACTN|nr:hypothetical protein [Streptomyces cupreus]MBC2906142.1 hypothetical protein [Streptomyces cupreus]